MKLARKRCNKCKVGRPGTALKIYFGSDRQTDTLTYKHDSLVEEWSHRRKERVSDGGHKGSRAEESDWYGGTPPPHQGKGTCAVMAGNKVTLRHHHACLEVGCASVRLCHLKGLEALYAHMNGCRECG